VQATARYPTPVINYVGEFSSLREAGLKGGEGLIGRDAARFTIFKRA
jgi:hypothetical protein